MFAVCRHEQVCRNNFYVCCGPLTGWEEIFFYLGWNGQGGQPAILCLHLPLKELMNSSKSIKERKQYEPKAWGKQPDSLESGCHCILKADAWIPLNRLLQSDTIELDNSKMLKGFCSVLVSWSAFLMLLFWMSMQLQWEGSLWPTLYSLLLALEEFLQQLQAASIAELLYLNVLFGLPAANITK